METKKKDMPDTGMKKTMPITSTKKTMPSTGMKKTEASEKKMPEVQMGKMKTTSSGEIPIPKMGVKSSPGYNKMPEKEGTETQTIAKMPRGAKQMPEKITEKTAIKNQTNGIMPRGAKPSPRHALASATPYKIIGDTPVNFLSLPNILSFWGNDVHGDCVTAEEAFAKACNNPEIFIPEQVVIDWAQS